MSTIDTRQAQAFPVLTPAQVETASRFASGPAQSFAPGSPIFAIGDEHAPTWLVLSGGIAVQRRDRGAPPRRVER